VKQPEEKKAPGTRWRFVSHHESATHLSGRVATITPHEPIFPWHYVVAGEDGGTWLAMDCELVAIAAEGAP
jgi:hypothetical protein